MLTKSVLVSHIVIDDVYYVLARKSWLSWITLNGTCISGFAFFRAKLGEQSLKTLNCQTISGMDYKTFETSMKVIEQ